MGNRKNGRKRKVKVRNIKKFIFSCTATVLIFFCIIIGLIKLNTTKVSKPTISSNLTSTMDSNKKTTPTSNNTKKESKPEKDTYAEILVTSVGDCTLGTDTKFGYENSLPCVLEQNNKDFSYFFKNVSGIFKEDDLTLANLETTFTNAKEKAAKTFNFKADAEYASSLTLASIDAVNISNNHIHDYLEKGFQDTKKALNANNIPYFGEGEKVIKTIKDQKIGLLGYQGWSSSKDFLDNVKKDIENMKKENCTVIINFHWGIEGQYTPLESQKNIAHFAIDNGADLIIGHHPHVVQTLEKYKDKLICYSMGNFCFGGNFNPKDKDTFILQTKLKFKNSQLVSYDTKIIPCSISSKKNINNYCPTPSEGPEKERILDKLKDLSPNFKNNIKDEFIPIK